MSKILKQETQFTDIDLVRQAIEGAGFVATFEPNYSTITMQGYANQFQANVGVTRANFKTTHPGIYLYGDFGFSQQADGTVGFTGDDLDIQKKSFSSAFDKIKSIYAEKQHVNTMYNAGYSVESRTVSATTGEVELVFAQTEYV